MDMYIKWKRLTHILEKICERPTFITLTNHDFSGGHGDAISAVVFNTEHAEILINSHEAKSLTKVIRALAHEAAHVVLGNANHNKVFNKKWNSLTNLIEEEYLRKV